MRTEAFHAMARIHGRGAQALAFVALAAVLALAGCSHEKDGQAQAAPDTPRNVTLTTAQRHGIHLYTVQEARYHKSVQTTGVVDFDNDQATSVLAPFSGPVARLRVALGDHVRKGQPLAVVDSSDFASAIGDYRKALATARNARRLADLDKDLLGHQGISRREADQAETDAVNAEADRDAALQALVALNVDPATLKAVQAGRPVGRIQGIIRAPIAGTVVTRDITPGELLQAGSTQCFTVADLSRVWVMAQVFGDDMARVHVGDPAEVDTGTGAKPLRGTVGNIASTVDPDTRSVMARVVVRNPDNALKKQMYVTVRIASRKTSTGLLVPVSAILRDDENLPFVYVAQKDGSFARRHVTLGYRAGDRYDLSGGLHAGDQVVVEGGLFMQFMQS